MKVGIVTKEWPPHIYGGAGVHVKYLAKSLQTLVDVDAHCFGEDRPDATAYELSAAEQQLNPAMQALITDAQIASNLAGVDIVHTHTWYANMAGHFAKTFGQRRLSEVTLPELQSWINYPEWSPRSRIHYATKISQLFNYAVKHGWADVNLAGRVARPGAEDSEPGILAVKQSNALLQCAPEFGLLPYVALGLFGGLRATETRRLEWSAVKLGERAIIIGSEVAKKRMRRAVEINDTLAAWIAPYVRERGPVVEAVAFRDGFDAMRAKAGISPWPANALRHSFGSYHLASYGDAVRTAAQMGNDANVVHRFYKALVTQAEAKHFWALRPEGEASNVVPIPSDAEHGAADATATEEASEKARQQSLS